MNTLNKIIKFLNEQPNSRPQLIAEKIGVSRQYIQRVLRNNNKLFIVSGSGPNRFYRNRPTEDDTQISFNKNRLIEDNFYSLDPVGNELIGEIGFIEWCKSRKFDVQKKRKEYINILNKYYPEKLNRPIDFTNKLSNVFKDDLALIKCWSCDYYNFEIFGKTKIGTQVLIAKQSGDEGIIDQLINTLNENVNLVRNSIYFDAIAFVPPTIQRTSQLMTKLEQNIALDIPRIKVRKVSARILVPQKTLKSIDDRILNAAQTFVVDSTKNYKKVLIIDDALGSGATLNEIAKQIISRKIGVSCYGLTIVASPSGYEVINEV